MDSRDSIDTILMFEYFKVTKNDNDKPIYILTLNKQKAYKMGLDGQKWFYQPGLYDYLFSNIDDNDIQIEPIDVSVVLNEVKSRQKKLGNN